MERKRHPLVAGLALGVVALASSTKPALAEPSIIKRPFRGARPLQLDLHAGFSFIGRGLAAGGRFGIPVVHNGFVKKINNAIYVNFGADLYFIDYKHGGAKGVYAPAVGIPVTMHWEFYFTRSWTAFGEVGPTLFLHPAVLKGDGWDWSPGHWFSAGVGGRYLLHETLALTLRLGSPYSSFGVSFFF